MASTPPTGQNSTEYSFNFDQLLEMFENLSGHSSTAETADSEREASTLGEVEDAEDRSDNIASGSTPQYLTRPSIPFLSAPRIDEDRTSNPPPLFSRTIPPLSATGKESHPFPSLLRRPIPPSSSGKKAAAPPPLPQRRNLNLIPSDDIPQDQDVDSQCMRVYQLSTSSSASGAGSSNDPNPSSFSPLSLRLNLQQLRKDGQLGQESDGQDSWKPLKISPGDISSRFRSPSSPSERPKIKKTVSIRSFSGDELTTTTGSSTSRSYKKISTRLITLTPRKKKHDETMHHQSACTSSSSSSDAPLTKRGLEETAPELLTMPQKKHKFSNERAAQEIVACLKRPGGMELVLNLFSQYHHLDKDKRLTQRWNQLLSTTLLYPQCLLLIHFFIRNESIHPDAFAQIIISGFHQKKTSPVETIYILSLYTLEDLKGEDPKTMFRNVHLSSSLHKEYGTSLLETFLKHMKKEIVEYWKRDASPADLCLNDKRIHEVLLQTYRGYDQLDLGKQLEIRGGTVRHNIETCKQFFRSFLQTLYMEPIPAACQDLLSMRRSQIFNKLKETMTAEDAFIQSEVLVGEIFFLRILNPCLVNSGKHSVEIDSLINLTKMIQAMSNQVKFGTEKHDEIFESFNEIYDLFIGMHHEFVNKNFPLRL